MNIADLDLTAAAERGILVPLIHPATGMRMKDEADVELAIKIAGMDSERWRNAAKKRKAASVEGGVSLELIDKRLSNITDLAMNDDIRAVMADSIIGLQGNWEWDGVKLEPIQKDMLKILMAPGFNWLCEDLLAAAGNRKLLFFVQPKG